MKAVVNGTQIELEPNSKPYLVKRIVADGFDLILIFGLFMLFTALILKLPIADDYHAHYEAYQTIQQTVTKEFQNDAEKISKALDQNETYQYELFAANLHGYLLKAGACFLSEALILLVIPLLNHNRQTLGKLMTGVMPFHETRQSRIKWYQVFFRFLLVFLFDSLVLYLLTGTLTFLLVAVLRLMEMLLNKKNKTLWDAMTGVMIIEKLSYDGIN